MTLVLDAGALIAFERGDREVARRIQDQLDQGDPPRTHGGVVGQVWRGGTQARLARLLAGIEVVPLTLDLGRRAGALLARSATSDVIDSALALIAAEGDAILTSDPDDLVLLLIAAGASAQVVPV